MSHHERRAHAIYTLAKHVVHASYETAKARGVPDWAAYPDVGEHDWLDVLERADQYAASIAPTAEAYDAAYQLLKERAAGEPA